MLRKLLKFEHFVIAIFLLTTLLSLGTHSFELDEGYGIYLSRNWGFLLNSLWYQEANMWFYYLLLHFWQNLGSKEIQIRLLSYLFSALSVPLLYILTKNMFDKKIALIASGLLSINMFFIFYAQQARGYSLALFLTLISSWSFLNLEKGYKQKLFFLFSSTLGVYTHFYCLFILAAQGLSALFARKLKIYLPYFIGIAVLALPIFIAPSFHSTQVDWIPAINLKNLIGTAFLLAGDFLPLFALYGILFLTGMRYFLNNYHKFELFYLLSWITMPVTFAYIISFISKPIYQSVYFLICLPPFLILSAVSLNKLRNSFQKYILITLIFFSFLRLMLWIDHNNSFFGILNNNAEDFRDTASYISQNSQTDDKIIFFGYYNRWTYEPYLKNNEQIEEIASGPYRVNTTLPNPDIEKIEHFSYPHIWLVIRETDYQYLNLDHLDQIESSLEKNYVLGEKTEFPDVIIYGYKFSR